MLVFPLIYLPHGDIFIGNDGGIYEKSCNRCGMFFDSNRVGGGGLGARSQRFPLRHLE